MVCQSFVRLKTEPEEGDKSLSQRWRKMQLWDCERDQCHYIIVGTASDPIYTQQRNKTTFSNSQFVSYGSRDVLIIFYRMAQRNMPFCVVRLPVGHATAGNLRESSTFGHASFVFSVSPSCSQGATLLTLRCVGCPSGYLSVCVSVKTFVFGDFCPTIFLRPIFVKWAVDESRRDTMLPSILVFTFQVFGVNLKEWERGESALCATKLRPGLGIHTFGVVSRFFWVCNSKQKEQKPRKIQDALQSKVRHCQLIDVTNLFFWAQNLRILHSVSFTPQRSGFGKQTCWRRLRYKIHTQESCCLFLYFSGITSLRCHFNFH